LLLRLLLTYHLSPEEAHAKKKKKNPQKTPTHFSNLEFALELPAAATGHLKIQ
jgi:hypothetical protein